MEWFQYNPRSSDLCMDGLMKQMIRIMEETVEERGLSNKAEAEI